MQICEYFITQYIDALLSEGGIDGEMIERNRKIIVNYYKCLFFGVTIDWLNDGMQEEKAQEFRRIFKIKADSADDIAAILKSQMGCA